MRPSARVMMTAMLALALCALPCFSHETDQFTLPEGREFADLGPYMNAWAYSAIERGVAKTNTRITQYLKNYRGPSELASLQAPDVVVRAVNAEFGAAYDVIEGFERKLYTHEMKLRYPGKLVAYKQQLGNIYQHVHFPLDPRQVFRLWHASTFMAYGTYVGTDKIGHFTDMGLHYYKAYTTAKGKGESDDAAFAAAVEVGTSGPLFSERGMVGYLSAGDYSNADLSANFLGLLFYLNLTEPVMIKGQSQPPMLLREGDLWVIAPHVRRDSDFFALFISEHLDEALNPGLFESGMRDKIRDAVKERASMVLNRRCDAHGNRRPRAFFDERLEQYKTYFGRDYGHEGTNNELVTIGNTCFELLASSADVKARNSYGYTPLHQAAASGDLIAVKRLVQNGADVNAGIRSAERYSPEWGNTPLHLAAAGGHAAVVEWLIEHGADVHARNDRGNTPLHRAVAAPAIVDLLLAKGARVDAADINGETPLHWAALDGQAEAVDILLNHGAAMTTANNAGHTPLHLAAMAGRGPIVQALLNHGADVRARNTLGCEALHLAIMSESAETVDLLAAQNADLRARDIFGRTPLHDAVDMGMLSAVKTLLAGGADVNVRDVYQTTPLHLASRRGRDDAAAVLLEHGADVNAQNAFGSSALHEAASCGDQRIVALLLKHGAKRFIRNTNGMTALQIASRGGYTEVMELLRKADSATLPKSSHASGPLDAPSLAR